MVEDKILRYTDGPKLKPFNPLSGTTELRNESLKSLSQPNIIHSSSAGIHLAKRQFLLALDGPGVSKEVYDYPISWSSGNTNLIAVACNDDIYYQDLDTKNITHLCSFDEDQGDPISLDWCKQNPTVLAVGTKAGSVSYWDVPTKKRVGSWQDIYLGDVGAMAWNGSVLASGLARGEVRLYDTRSSASVGKITKHKSKVIGCRWSTDGMYLATSDKQGILNIWDSRAGKELTDSDRLGGRLKHGGPVKVCRILLSLRDPRLMFL